MTADDPLSVLEVIERLEIGPVEVEPRRIEAPYRIVGANGEDRLELAYRYEEDVFDPERPADRQLAAMITAQLALNYGLFCREIVFHGPLDAVDQRFLRDSMANTSREILVKKFLQPNPFLDPSVQALRVAPRPDFTRARLRFESGDESAPSEHWAVDGERYAVLSSGGKDSLLSYGLLHELGYEVHPIYLNESGRHWMTALNAYRHFAEHVPHTGRVWTSCDRVFAGMLRQLPFVRPDFARLRSDEYPIRLWTVAVFLFGALPLLRRRGIGRLVIGDEYDTTVRARYRPPDPDAARDRGIPHYDGLFDQSRYFDETLSRYFQRKGWGVSQFSLLRPASEMLIEKTLAERYPDLLRLQVSCHAAHKEGDRVHPCGKCEKCRRIVGMLRALGADPAICGYHPEQEEEIFAALLEDGVHQELPGAEHLAHLLHEKGLIPEPRLGTARARAHPEALQLRFHREKSPLDALPVPLRRPLYRLLLEHAEGAVRRQGRRWIPFDLLQAPELTAPYRFDRPGEAEANTPRASYLWGEMTWPEADRRLRSVDIALLPVGAIEQHGPHLPLDVDSFDADYLARRVAEAASEPKPLVLPLIPYGVSYHHDDFRGTLSIDNDTLSRLIYDIGISVAKNGITKLVIINGHGGNGPALHHAAQMINRDARIFTCVDSGETSDADIDQIAESENDVHAGEIETSTTLAVRPHLVRLDLARESTPSFSNRYLDFSSQRSVGWYARTEHLAASGVLGDPEKATVEKGEQIWRVMIDNLVELVDHLKGLSLEEIHQRRY